MKNKGTAIQSAARTLLTSFWAAQLINTNSYYVVYLLVGGLALLAWFHNRATEIGALREGLRGRNGWLSCTFAVFFSLMVTFANYDMWSIIGQTQSRSIDILHKLSPALLQLLFFSGGFCVFRQIFCALADKVDDFMWKDAEGWTPKVVFAACFLLITAINCCVLFLCRYPGVLTPDSISQIKQILSGEYSNHHPFYHTIIIRTLMAFGMCMFHDINVAVAMYSVFQIVFMAACFAFCVKTMAQMRAPKGMLILSGAFFSLMPYHIAYSFTMWKDVLFGGCVLLVTLAVFRLINSLGRRRGNVLLFAFSGFGMCLLRSNGLFAFVLLGVFFTLLLRRRLRRVMILFAGIILFSFILKYPVLKALDVNQPDTIESLSIPAQQVARLIKQGRTLSEEERELLERVIDVEMVPEAYVAHISDPVKDLVRQRGNQDALRKDKLTYLKLYISLGLKYPQDYLCAWVDQTRGYWNSGYDYWILRNNVSENNIGIHQSIAFGAADVLLRRYQSLFTQVQVLRLLVSIGLCIWVIVVALFVCILRRDKLGAFLTLPALIVNLSLLIATPVFSEFRYIYAAYCVVPFVVVCTLRPATPGDVR